MRYLINYLTSTPWNFMRWVQLGAGLWFSMAGILHHDIFPGLVGGIFMFQAITNTGCCGTTCTNYPDKKKNTVNETEEISYTEIKE